MKRIFLFLLILLPFAVRAQVVSTIAGTGSNVYSGNNGPATAAGIPDPAGGEFDKWGNYYFADATNDHRVRKIDNTGIITAVAGNGSGGYNGDGIIATTASLYNPAMVRVDTSGNLYVCDAANHRIRKVDMATNIITTIVGTGVGTYGGDGGPATAAQIYDPQDICFDKWGNLYIADLFNYRIRKVSPTGTISTIAGNGTPGYTGDGVPADTTQIGLILGICADTSGNIYLADNTHYRVRKIDAVTGIITTIAGNGISGTYIGDNMPATDAQIIAGRVFVDRFNNLFIVDKTNYRVYKVDATGTLYNIVGNGVAADGGDGGSATAASLNYPIAVAMDACGDLYIPTIGSSTSGSGRRIRKITYPPILTIPTIALSGIPSATIGALVTVIATVTNAGSSYEIEWYNHGVLFNTTTIPSVTYTKPAGIDTITAKVVSTATYGCYDSTTSAGHVVMVSDGVPFDKLTMTEVTVFPNPVNRQLTIISVNPITSIVVSNLLGQVVYTHEYNAKQVQVDVADLPKGVYFVRVNGTEVRKFVKE